MTSITPGRSFHARPSSPHRDVQKQEQARQDAQRAGDHEEADRCFDRKQDALSRLARMDERRRQATAIHAPPKPGKRDPLLSFPRHLRAAADALRDSEASNSLRLGPGFAADYVEGGQSAGMEALVDRKRRDQAAWQRAVAALPSDAFHGSVYNVIVYRCSLASQLNTRTSSAERRALVDAIWLALEAAANYFRIDGR